MELLPHKPDMSNPGGTQGSEIKALRRDAEIKQAIRHSRHAFRWAFEDAARNREHVMEALSSNIEGMDHVPEPLESDKEILDFALARAVVAHIAQISVLRSVPEAIDKLKNAALKSFWNSPAWARSEELQTLRKKKTCVLCYHVR